MQPTSYGQFFSTSDYSAIKEKVWKQVEQDFHDYLQIYQDIQKSLAKINSSYADIDSPDQVHFYEKLAFDAVVSSVLKKYKERREGFELSESSDAWFHHLFSGCTDFTRIINDRAFLDALSQFCFQTLKDSKLEAFSPERSKVHERCFFWETVQKQKELEQGQNFDENYYLYQINQLRSRLPSHPFVGEATKGNKKRFISGLIKLDPEEGMELLVFDKLYWIIWPNTQRIQSLEDYCQTHPTLRSEKGIWYLPYLHRLNKLAQKEARLVESSNTDFMRWSAGLSFSVALFLECLGWLAMIAIGAAISGCPLVAVGALSLVIVVIGLIALACGLSSGQWQCRAVHREKKSILGPIDSFLNPTASPSTPIACYLTTAEAKRTLKESILIDSTIGGKEELADKSPTRLPAFRKVDILSRPNAGNEAGDLCAKNFQMPSMIK